jgi:nicotinate-nucleotide adenylyltransferase
VPDRPAAEAGARSIGILGGTFNPPHLGHLVVADHARSALGLELVLLTPAHIPPHKPTAPDPGSERRLAMCRLAVEGADGVAVCAVELERGGPSYTVDTLRSIHASHPHAELTFIVGADVASTLPSWREPRELLELADLAVAARVGTDRAAVVEAVAGLRGGPASEGTASEGAGGELPVRFLDMAEIEISSSMVRRRVAAGESIEELVGPAVAGYIAEHDLYRDDVGAIA